MCDPLRFDRTQFENIALSQPPKGTDEKAEVRKGKLSKAKGLQSSRARTRVQNILSERLCPWCLWDLWLSV